MAPGPFYRMMPIAPYRVVIGAKLGGTAPM